MTRAASIAVIAAAVLAPQPAAAQSAAVIPVDQLGRAARLLFEALRDTVQ